MAYQMILVLVAVPLAWVAMAFGYRWYLRVPLVAGFLLALGAGVSGCGALEWTNGKIIYGSPFWYRGFGEPRGIAFLAFLVLVAFAAALVAKCYLAWFMDRASAAERAPNALGLRAWLNPANLVIAAMIILGAYVSLGWSIWATATGMLALLLAYPVANIVIKGGTNAHAAGRDELADERRRVLALVEAGKISGEDGAELIGALGQTRAAALDEPGSLTAGKHLMLLGALVVLVGFCLPWFEVNVGMLMRDTMKAMRLMSESDLQMPGIPGGITFTVPGSGAAVPTPLQNASLVDKTISLTVRGGDLQYALGWLILSMGIAAAVLPVIWPTDRRNRGIQRGISLAALIAGSVILIYVATNVMGTGDAVRMAIGMFLAILGYGVLCAGAVREYFPARGGSGPVVLPTVSQT